MNTIICSKYHNVVSMNIISKLSFFMNRNANTLSQLQWPTVRHTALNKASFTSGIHN